MKRVDLGFVEDNLSNVNRQAGSYRIEHQSLYKYIKFL